MISLQWKVQERPSGLYRAFYKRRWPMAVFKGTGEIAVRIECPTPYKPNRAGVISDHEPLLVYVADYSTRREVPEAALFEWVFIGTAATLADAKHNATVALINAPETWPDHFWLKHQTELVKRRGPKRWP